MNENEIAYWNGAAGGRWAAQQVLLDQRLAPIGDALLERSALQPGQKVVDVGCGCGASSLAFAERVGPTGSVLGVDISAPMLAIARERAAAAKVPRLRFVQADAASHSFGGTGADLVASRLGVMFFDDPIAAFRNLATAIRPAGRFVFVCFRGPERNDFFRVPREAAARVVQLPPPPPPHAPGPMALADGERTRGLLSAAGFLDVELEARDVSILVGTDVDDAVKFSIAAGPLARAIAELPAEDVERLRAALTDALSARKGPQGIAMNAAIWCVSGRTKGP